MVNLFPKDFSEIASDPMIPFSERDTFELFKDLNNDWYVWYSREWAESERNTVKLGECDFLILHPKWGFLSLEIKGGLIYYEGLQNTWYTRKIHYLKVDSEEFLQLTEDYIDDDIMELLEDDKKNLNISQIDPFRQARRSMTFLHNKFMQYVKDYRRFDLTEEGEDGKKRPLFKYHYGVIFPDCKFKEKMQISPFRPLASVRESIFDKSDFNLQKEWRSKKKQGVKTLGSSPLEQFLIDLFKFRPNTISVEAVKFFQDCIAPKILFSYPLSSWIENRRVKYDEINSIQDMLINFLDFKNKCVIYGSAGTGKTYIGMKKIIHELKKKKRVLYLCFNRGLKEHIISYVKETYSKIIREITQESLSDQEEKKSSKINSTLAFSVYTIDKYLYAISKEIFTDTDKTQFINAHDNKNYNFIRDLVSKYFTTASDSISRFKWDTIIIDEAQDFQKEYLQIIPFFYRSDKSILWVFVDPEQSVFKREIFHPNDVGMEENSDKFFLGKNLRNGNQIVEWIKGVTKKGNYSDLLGIDGKITYGPVSKNIEGSFKWVCDQILYLYNTQEIKLSSLAILSNKTMNKLDSSLNLQNNECKITFNYDDKSKIEENIQYSFILYQTQKKQAIKPLKTQICIVEPKVNEYLDKIAEQLNEEEIVLYNNLRIFKGLERDIIFLIIPQLTDVIRANEIMMQDIYVAASRARFFLYIAEYEDKSN